MNTAYLLWAIAGAALYKVIVWARYKYRRRPRHFYPLTQSTPWAAALLQSLPDAAALYNENRQLLHANQALHNLLPPLLWTPGSHLQQLQKHLFPQVIPDAGGAGTLLPALMSATEIITRPVRIGQRDFLLRTAAVAVPPPTMGEPICYLLTLSDTSELRGLQIQRDNTLRFLSHDIRGPAASILSLLRTQALNPQAHNATQQATHITQQTQSLLHLIDHFALRTQAEAGPYHLREEFLETLLYHALQEQQEAAQERGHKLTEPLSESHVFVHVDARLFVRMLGQMLHVAISQAPRQSTIQSSIAIHTPPGEGHSAQTLISIRYPNIASQESTSANAAPQAIDLQLARTIAQRHSGHIEHTWGPTHTSLQLRLPCVVA